MAGIRSAPSVLIHPLEAEFGWSRTAISGAASLNLLLLGLFAPVGGWLIDRFGRKPALLTGLALFATFSAIGAAASTSGQLIAARALMGIGAALIFPTTLAILSNVFTDTKERAQAIGIWSAVTGAAVALGPIAGGFLLEHFWWGSVLLINVPICAIAIFLGWKILPNSKDADAPRLDIGGLMLSIMAVGTHIFFQLSSTDADKIASTLDGGKRLAETLKNLPKRRFVVKSGSERPREVLVPTVSDRVLQTAVARWLNRNYPLQRDVLLQRHTWNFATARAMLAVLENFQEEGGSVAVPADRVPKRG
jgi:MFS family permease